MNSESYFDQVAGRWDAMRHEYFPESIREKALAVAQVCAGAVAVDIGAGTGFITEALLQNGLRVIAIDQSQAMLAQLRQKFPPPAPLELHRSGAEQLSLATAAVDFVFANMLLHHVERPAVAIREMARILKPGGKLVITDMDEHEHEFLLIEQHDRWPGFKRQDIRAWFTAAGLNHVQVDCLDETCCAAADCTPERADVSIFVAVGVR